MNNTNNEMKIRSMKVIVAIVVSCFAACTNRGATKVISPKKDSLAHVENPAFMGCQYRLMNGNYDTYRTYFHISTGQFENNDTVTLTGAWYISARGKNKLNVTVPNPQRTKIISGKKFYVEFIDDQLGTIRITNYKGILKVLDHQNEIRLKPNETLLINSIGKYNKFYNDYAGVDSMWLKGSLLRFENVNLPLLIRRIAQMYGYFVSFNNQSYNILSKSNNTLSIGNVVGSFDCTERLGDGLKLLQTIVQDSLKFSYDI